MIKQIQAPATWSQKVTKSQSCMDDKNWGKDLSNIVNIHLLYSEPFIFRAVNTCLSDFHHTLTICFHHSSESTAQTRHDQFL